MAVHPSQRRLRREGLPSLLAVLALAGCASTPEAGLRLPTRQERVSAAAAGFEVGPVRKAHELLPANLLEGPHYRVGEEVVTHEFVNHYWITSDYGDFEAAGDDQLHTRIREIEAIAAMREMSKTAEFAGAAAEALKSPFVATWNLVTNPVDSITGVPVVAWEAIQNTARLARGERGEFEDSGWVEFIGFEAKKRQIAREMGVDPYSSNKALQRQLNRFAWAAYAGGLPFMFVPFVEDDGVAEEELAPAERLNEMLLYYSPEDLRRLNRIELAVMGVPKPQRDEFVRNRWYSPRHQTVLVEALAALDLSEDRSEFVRVAATASSEDEARFYQRTAELLRTYGDHVTPIRKIVAVDSALMGYTEQGDLVLPLPADYAVWDPSTEALALAMTRAPPSEGPSDSLELVLSGTLSPMARQRIGALGVVVTERAFENLASDSARSSLEPD